MQIIWVLAQSFWVFVLLGKLPLLFVLWLVSVQRSQVGLRHISHTFASLGLRVKEDCSLTESRWGIVLAANFKSTVDCPQNFLNQDGFEAIMRFSSRLSVAICSGFLYNFSCSKRRITNQNSPIQVRANYRSYLATFHCCLVNLN